MSLADLSTAQAVGLSALIAVQISLMIIALRAWLRKTQHANSTLTGAPKWLSLVLIVLGQIIGPIIFLVVIAPQYEDPPSRHGSEDRPHHPKGDRPTAHDIWETR